MLSTEIHLDLSISLLLYVALFEFDFALSGTFKLKKNDYKRQGFNPAVVKDDVYFLHPKSGEYEALDEATYRDICCGIICF